MERNQKTLNKVQLRKMASNLGLELDRLELDVTELRGQIVCHICETPARPGKTRWYRCHNLHQICQECKETNGKEKCYCNQPILIVYCEWTEKFLKKIKGSKLNCKNTKNGCKETFHENALEDHELECLFRLVPCMESKSGCEAKLTLQNVIQHYEKEHLKDGLQSIENKLKRVGGSITNVKMDLNGNVFIVKGQIFGNKTAILWVYILGSPKEAKHFTYTLKLFGSKSTIMYVGKVAAIDESFDTLYMAGKCFTFQFDTFKDQFKNEDGNYEYSLEIRNLKEEAKDENVDSGASDIEDSNE